MTKLSATLFALLAAGPILAGQTDHSMRMYDAANEVKITATVDSITEVSSGMMAGIHLTLRTADQTKDALLGPEKFLTEKGFSFVRGETVDVTGSSMTMGGMTTLIVREIAKGGRTLVLRDKEGAPAWQPKESDQSAMNCCDRMKNMNHQH